LGVATALGTAQLLTAQLLGRPPAIDPAPYRPDRPMAEHAA
jgi:glycine/D-amino acid oxidase-like deaminating enzyme